MRRGYVAGQEQRQLIYEWRCLECDEIVEVSRLVADYKRGPKGDETLHRGCNSTSFKRILSVPKSIRIPENEDQYW